MYKNMATCDFPPCHNTVECHPDEGPPTGWFLLARMTGPGSWDEDEWHYCSTRCLSYAWRNGDGVV